MRRAASCLAVRLDTVTSHRSLAMSRRPTPVVASKPCGGSSNRSTIVPPATCASCSLFSGCATRHGVVTSQPRSELATDSRHRVNTTRQPRQPIHDRAACHSCHCSPPQLTAVATSLSSNPWLLAPPVVPRLWIALRLRPVSEAPPGPVSTAPPSCNLDQRDQLQNVTAKFRVPTLYEIT